jgi:hypothetical protein
MMDYGRNCERAKCTDHGKDPERSAIGGDYGIALERANPLDYSKLDERAMLPDDATNRERANRNEHRN